MRWARFDSFGLLIRYFDTFGLLCVILHAFMFTFMHCLITCDGETYVTCVLSTLIYIYVMSLGYAHLFASVFYSDSNELYFLVFMLISYLLSTPCWLGSYKHV